MSERCKSHLCSCQLEEGEDLMVFNFILIKKLKIFYLKNLKINGFSSFSFFVVVDQSKDLI